MKIATHVQFLVALFCFTPGIGAASEDEFDLSSRIDAVLSEASSDGSGYAVIVELDGEIILSRGYGLAVRESNTAFTTATIAQIGSLTKQFNAAAILQLAENGKVNLTAPIADYIPEVASLAGNITLHQLLTHSSGLPEYCGEDFEPISRDEFVDDCLSLPLAFEPGTDVAYSNIGYGVIAVVVELVAEQDFDSYLKEQVLSSNGLHSTGHLFPPNFDADFAHGYLDGKDMGNIANRIDALDGEWWNLKGNGGIQASTQDMYAWYKALNGGKELSASIRSELSTPHSPWVDGVAEGYGWYFRSADGVTIRQMSHSGSDGVFFSYYWHRPDQRAFMYFVGNSGEEPVKKSLREILEILNTMIDGPR